jgi:hypothetical protein
VGWRQSQSDTTLSESAELFSSGAFLLISERDWPRIVPAFSEVADVGRSEALDDA